MATIATTSMSAPTDAQVRAALQSLIATTQAEATAPGASGAQQAAARAVVAAATALATLYAPAQRATTTITVEDGDTLWSLALAVYGNARTYWQLVTLNELTDPRLMPGQTLVVPVL